jgi:hypothetical protein
MTLLPSMRPSLLPMGEKAISPPFNGKMTGHCNFGGC